MKKIKSIKDLNDELRISTGVVIGNFDGLHLGHQKLLSGFKQKCRELNCIPVLVTFDPHPLVFFSNNNPQVLILDKDSKNRLLSDQSIENVLELNFDKNLQKLGAKDFFEQTLFEISDLKLIYLGHDFKLGRGAMDAIEVLRSCIKERDIEIVETPAFEIDGGTCSSSSIRGFLKLGQIDRANQYLGYNYFLEGEVVRGDGVGAALIVATANLEVEPTVLIPKNGVYLTRVVIDGKNYKSVTNIGKRPTLAINNFISIETHVLNFNQEIYGLELRVEFIEKIRDERRFDSIEKLKEQIQKDIKLRDSYER